MTTVIDTYVEESTSAAVSLATEKSVRQRRTDSGSKTLPEMEHFVALVRKTKRPDLVLHLVEAISQSSFGAVLKLPKPNKAALPMAKRDAFYAAVAELANTHRAIIEFAAEQIILLADPHGRSAVMSLLNEQNPNDQNILQEPTDPYSRALYLYIRSQHPEQQAKSDARFEQAQHIQVMNQQWKSANYSSHYLGPQHAEPNLNADAEEKLRSRIAELYPKVPADQILIDCFVQQSTAQDVDADDDAENTANALHVLVATFNGTKAHFKKVEEGDLVEHEEDAALTIRFAWEASTGALTVFSDDQSNRQQLAHLFSKSVLEIDGTVQDVPMREFNLNAFLSPAILDSIRAERLEGIDQIIIQQLKVARVVEKPVPQSGNRPDKLRKLVSPLTIGRDRYDDREIYQIAYEEHGLDSLAGYELLSIKLSMKIAKQPHRKAHLVSIDMSAPNRLSEKSKTAEDRRLVLQQLERIGVLKSI